MAEVDDVKTLLDAGAASVGLDALRAVDDDAADVVAAVVPEGYQIKTADVAAVLARYREAPRRVTGTAVVTDTASWLAYFAKHKRTLSSRVPEGGGDPAVTCASEVYGDVARGTVTAVLNAPAGPDDPAWGDHRVVLQLQHSASWLAWTARDGKPMSQSAFAEHIEDRSPDFRTPDAATMLEIAQTFRQKTGVTFESSQRLSNGETRFQYLETVEAKAGSRGQIDVPSSFTLLVQPWRGVALAVPLTARLRSRTSGQGLTLLYVLDQVEDRMAEAWASLLAQLTETLPVPVLAGQAPSYGG